MDLTTKGTGIGQPVRRREDFRLVRGAGRYTADENLPGQVYAVMVRSPHAHARIRAIRTDEAKAVPGVLAVLTGADCVADGLKPVPHKPWSPHPAETRLRNKGNARHCRKASKSNKMKHLNRSVWSPRPRCTGIRLM